jgi:radical SAM superfamily enzyme YgiQ (UPF0313 family)
MGIALVNPPRVIEKFNIWSGVISVTPPFGLMVLSAVLEREGYKADIIDAFALNLDLPEIASMIDPGTSLIGITSTTVEIEDAKNIARYLRERFPDKKIIMGGVHPTIFHKELLGDNVCDAVVRGEGERAIVELAGGAPWDSIKGLTWKSPGGDIVINPGHDDYVDLDSLPMPAYHKIPMKAYRSALGAAKRHPSIGMITSRGCPGKCTFCYSGMHGRKIRLMSAAKIIEEIRFLKDNYGIREISFYDDTFTFNRKRVAEICTRIIENRLGIKWTCFARVDAINTEMLDLMRRAGCHQLSFGFESPDEEILKNINKRITPEKIENAVKMTRNAGINVRGAFMLGNPGETEQSMRKTIDYSRKLGIQFAIFNITTPFPGTALFDWAEAENCIAHKKWELYDLAQPVLRLPTVDSDKVQKYYKLSYREFYLRPSYMLSRMFSITTWYEFKTHLQAFLGILMILFRRKHDA